MCTLKQVWGFRLYISSFMFLRYPFTLCGLIRKLCTFAECHLNEYKGKEVSTTSGIAQTRKLEGCVRRFLTSDTAARYSNIISHWALLPGTPIKLDDFVEFELVTLVENFGLEKVVERPHPLYESLVLEFYTNFNTDIDTPGS